MENKLLEAHLEALAHLKPYLTIVGGRCLPEASSVGRENEIEGGLEIILEYRRQVAQPS